MPIQTRSPCSAIPKKYVDLIDLKANQFRTLPVEDVLHTRYPILRYIAQLSYEGYLTPIRSSLKVDPKDLVVNMDEMLRRTPFADRMRRMLKLAGEALPFSSRYGIRGQAR